MQQHACQAARRRGNQALTPSWAGFFRSRSTRGRGRDEGPRRRVCKEVRQARRASFARRGRASRDGVPTGIRTPVAAVKGRCPRPLDDGDADGRNSNGGTGGGTNRDRTGDLYNANVALSQLSYGPTPRPWSREVSGGERDRSTLPKRRIGTCDARETRSGATDGETAREQQRAQAEHTEHPDRAAASAPALRSRRTARRRRPRRIAGLAVIVVVARIAAGGRIVVLDDDRQRQARPERRARDAGEHDVERLVGLLETIVV